MEPSNPKARLLAQRLAGKHGTTTTRKTIPPRPANTPRALSPAQRRIWYLHQADPGSPLFNVLNCFWFKGKINPAILQKSVRTILERQELLRSICQSNGELVSLHPQPSDSFQLEVFELPGEAITSAAKAETNKPFNLTKEIPLRLLLFQATGNHRSLIVLITHDLVFDKWSLGLFWRELSLAYQQRDHELPPLPIQYFDFAHWQENLVKTTGYQKQLDSWIERLDSTPPILELPSDQPPPLTRSDSGQLAIRQISPELTSQLRQLAASQNLSLFTLLLAAFKIFLHRMCCENDIVVGTPIANRRASELSNLIGFFLTTSPLRTDLSGNPSFLEALARVRETVEHALENQDIAFDDLVRQLNPPRQPGQHPFFSTMFIFQREQEAVPPIDIPGCTFEMTYLMADVAKVDLSLFAAERNGGLETIFEYRTDHFSRLLMEKLLENFATLLESLVTSPTASVGNLNLLSPTDNSFRTTSRPHPAPPLLLEKISHTVGENPTHPAIDGEKSLSYQELWDRSATLAQILRARGLQKQPVALLLPRGPEAIIAIIAILRSGNAYLPLDPSLPDQRLSEILSSGTPRATVTDSSNLKRLDSSLPTFTVPTESKNITLPLPLPEDLAYLILTSGSTGQPKPVAITHLNLAHSNLARKTCYPDSPKRFLLISSLSFDSSVAGLFWTLSEGGTVIPMPVGLEQNIESLADFIQTQNITHLLSLPALYQLLLEHNPVSKLQSLRQVIVAGESCPSHLARIHHKKLPECQLFNEYGPTEATVWCAVHQVTAGDQPVPIGQPIPGIELQLLDSQLQPVPLGMIGEIAVSGPTLAQGYYNNPELTARRFLAPSSNRARTYLTGDLARQTLDGTFYFLGRKDRQLKIRGFRIEPGEIESVLCQLPAIREAAILPQQQLHAFLVSDTPPGHEEIRAHLRSRLPDYMVPATIRFLPKLPFLTNGKIDARALASHLEQTQSHEETILPRTPLEETLAQIWSETLKQPSPGIHDNFFECGGDSISSIRFLAKARVKGIQLETSDLFQSPTIAALSTLARKSHFPLADSEQNLPDSFPLSPIQQWFFEQNMPDSHHWNLAFRTDLRHPLPPEAIESAYQSLLLNHPLLRVTFPTGSDQQREHQTLSLPISDSGKTPFRLIEVTSREDIEDHLNSLNSSLALEGTLTGLALFQTPDRQQSLVFFAHHLLADAASLAIIHEDLGLLLNGDTPLPETSSFASHVANLHQQAHQPESTSALVLWNSPPIHPYSGLPAIQSPLPETEANLHSHTFHWEKTLDNDLLSQVNRAFHTQTQELILTAVTRALLFEKDSSPQTLRLSLESHGRGPEHSQTVAWFTTAYPLNLSLTNKMDRRDSLVEVKEQFRALSEKGQTHGLLRYLHPSPGIRAQLSNTPPEHLLFNFLGQNLLPEPSATSPFTNFQPLFTHARSPDNPASHPLEVLSFIRNQKLSFSLRYLPNYYSHPRISNLSTRILEELQLLFEECLATPDSSFTPSDFPDADLDGEDLAELLDSLD